jgi:cytochrome P450
VPTLEPGLIDVDFTDPELNCDPYPFMEEWRAKGSVVYNESNNRYLVLSYKNCARVLSRIDLFDSQDSSRQEHFVRMHGGLTMEAIDDNRQHQAVRGIWAAEFERGNLSRHRDMISEIITEEISRFVDLLGYGNVVDAIPHMFRRIPQVVIAKMLGIDADMYEEFASWGHAIGQSIAGERDPSPAGQKLIADGLIGRNNLKAYLTDVVHRRRRRGPGGTDLISEMVFSEYGRETMSDEEILANCAQLVFAGNETTVAMMGLTMAALAGHPEQRRQLVADRTLIPQAFEEVHRWTTLVQTLPRHAATDASDIEGILVPQGAEIWAMMGAGNRDPQRWENPAVFDIGRTSRQHLGFGFGMHVCLGLNLARLEIQLWLNELLDRLPDFEVGPIDFGQRFPFPTRAPLSVPVSRG